MSIHRKLEIVANAAIVVVALLIVWVAVTKYIFPKPIVEALATGQQMPLSDVDWRTNQRTVVLVLKKGCHLCDDSAGFHQGVLSLAKERGISVVAALPDEPPEGQAYVTSLALEIPAIKAVSLAKLRILRVPAVILVDRNGMVERVWSGKLSAVQEKDVLRTLGEPIVLGRQGNAWLIDFGVENRWAKRHSHG